ncbi:hypothetical protein [Methanoplanus limicola]|uniref:Uncharacterized protein n=1 Tax=Methanoplanus limicola DSM 2279 TaxID=937775 RepID=H1YZQ6_9EURY|nr:hypothetical protein [Methanoplanus limicola]EHQ34318.1 hypothetical protein Metlim_0165 [Methanoplanus limicola DSM 2279]
MNCNSLFFCIIFQFSVLIAAAGAACITGINVADNILFRSSPDGEIDIVIVRGGPNADM